MYEESKTAFEKIFSDSGNGVYVVGYYHFGGWDGVFPIYNTKKHVAQRQQNIEDSGDEDSDYFKIDCQWAPTDFHDLERYTSMLPKSEKALMLLKPEITATTEESQNAWQETLNCMVDVLCRLDKEGFFSQFIERDDLVLHIATYDEDYEPRYERIKRLNPSSVVSKIKEDFEYAISERKRWEKSALLGALRN